MSHEMRADYGQTLMFPPCLEDCLRAAAWATRTETPYDPNVKKCSCQEDFPVLEDGHLVGIVTAGGGRVPDDPGCTEGASRAVDRYRAESRTRNCGS